MGGKGRAAQLTSINVADQFTSLQRPTLLARESMEGIQGGLTMRFGHLALLAMALIGGCGSEPATSPADGGNGATATGSCRTVITYMGTTTTTCAEYTGLTVDQVAAFKVSCKGGPLGDLGISTMGTWSDGTCSRTNVVGGCRIGSGSFKQTVWYYSGPGITEATAMQGCSAAGGTYVAP